MKEELEEVKKARELILNTFNKLEFVEETHQYFLPKEDGTKEELDCVSHITHKFANPFDEEKAAEKYALKNGFTKEYWLDAWKYKALCATTQGTLSHEYGESYAWLRDGQPEKICPSCLIKYNKEKGWLVPTRPKEVAIKKFWDELNENLHFVLSETKVYSGNDDKAVKLKNNYAGTFDLLLYYKHPSDDSKSGLVIMDYKTNADLYKAYSKKVNKMLLPPFDKYYDEAFSLYTLQLSCYQLPLEDIGLKVVGRRIIWLKDDGTYELIPVDCVTKELKSVL